MAEDVVKNKLKRKRRKKKKSVVDSAARTKRKVIAGNFAKGHWVKRKFCPVAFC